MKYLLNKYHLNIPDNELIADIKKAVKKKGGKCISYQDYDALGEFSASMLADRFGGWNAAVKKAGLKVVKYHIIPKDELLSNLKHVWDSLDRQPLIKDMVRPLSEHSASTYAKNFGSWRAALVAFVEYMKKPGNKKIPAKRSGNKKHTLPHPVRDRLHPSPKGLKSGRQERNKKMNRCITKSMRFDVFRRDHFKCRLCGASPAVNPKIILHVDHIKPQSKGGRTILKNLQTLCSECNIGKGAKVMKLKKGK